MWDSASRLKYYTTGGAKWERLSRSQGLQALEGVIASTSKHEPQSQVSLDDSGRNRPYTVPDAYGLCGGGSVPHAGAARRGTRRDAMSDWERLADDKAIQTTMAALERHGIAAMVVQAGEDAKSEALKLVPTGSEVLTNTSISFVRQHLGF